MTAVIHRISVSGIVQKFQSLSQSSYPPSESLRARMHELKELVSSSVRLADKARGSPLSAAKRSIGLTSGGGGNS